MCQCAVREIAVAPVSPLEVAVRPIVVPAPGARAPSKAAFVACTWVPLWVKVAFHRLLIF